MSRYIKFDDAVKVMACEMCAEAQSQGDDVDGIEDFMPEAKAWLNDAPSIDIVRCKECKHYETDMWAEKGTYWCGRISDWGNCKYINTDDFCSRGEKERSVSDKWVDTIQWIAILLLFYKTRRL